MLLHAQALASPATLLPRRAPNARASLAHGLITPARLSTKSPSLILAMSDGSFTMTRPFSGKDGSDGGLVISKGVEVNRATNLVMASAIVANTQNFNEVRERILFSRLVYGGPRMIVGLPEHPLLAAAGPFLTLDQLNRNPLGRVQDPVETAGTPVVRPIWLPETAAEVTAQGDTPMLKAAVTASELYLDWRAGRPRAPHNVVILHATDMAPTDGSFDTIAMAMTHLRETVLDHGGTPFVTNVLLSETPDAPILIPSKADDLSPEGRFIYRISGSLSSDMVVRAREHGLSIGDGDPRLAFINAPPAKLPFFFSLGTSGVIEE